MKVRVMELCVAHRLAPRDSGGRNESQRRRPFGRFNQPAASTRLLAAFRSRLKGG